MKKIKDLTREEKIKLLKLISSGDIDHTEINEETYVLENENELLPFVISTANRKRSNPDFHATCTALDIKVLAKIRETEAAFQKIAEKRKAKTQRSTN